MAALHANNEIGTNNGNPQYNSASLDIPEIKEMLGLMKGSLGTIAQQFQTLNEQGKKVDAFGPSKESLKVHTDVLEQEMMSAQEVRDEVLMTVRKRIKEQLKEKVAKTMHEHIVQQIRTSISAQVGVQFSIQIAEHLPEPLEQQVEEGRKQIEGIKAAFHNSEARRANALLRTDRLDDRLEKVYKPDHTESSRYPTNLRSLFAYTAGQAQALAQDYELTATGSREEIINRFMTHIGVLFPLLWMSLGAEE